MSPGAVGVSVIPFNHSGMFAGLWMGSIAGLMCWEDKVKVEEGDLIGLLGPSLDKQDPISIFGDK